MKYEIKKIIIMFWNKQSDLKAVNPIYTTFKGGLGSWNEEMTEWERFCLWGHFRLCYDENNMLNGWKHISFHGYKFGYTYTPVKKLLWNFNWHFAVNKKWPFMKFGFLNVWKLVDQDKF